MKITIKNRESFPKFAKTSTHFRCFRDIYSSQLLTRDQLACLRRNSQVLANYETKTRLYLNILENYPRIHVIREKYQNDQKIN